jgi:broad specificity phosphatase PhoE
MQLHCLRHGMTIENTKGIYQGTTDGTLTSEQHSALTKVRFETSHYDVIYCSPLGRCSDTAQALGIQSWITDTRISERNFGIFENLSRKDCEVGFPEEFGEFQRFDEHYQIPNGESRAQHLARILEWILENRRFEKVLAITHGGTIDFLYRMAIGLEVHGGSEIYSATNASLSIFAIEWPQIELVTYDARLVGE